MRWSLKLGSLAGAGIYVHVTFALLIAWVAADAWQQQATLAFVGSQLVFLAALFACVLLHELGHTGAARRYGIATRDITLLPIGGLARLERMPKEPTSEFVIAAAGPAVNLVIAGVLIAVLSVSSEYREPIAALSDPNAPLLWRLTGINLVLVVFNLVPAFPMDGGRMLRALLGLRLGWLRATFVATTVGQATAALFVGLGILGNPILLVIGLFVLLAAAGERRMAETEHALGGLSVDSAAVKNFVALTPDHSLHAVAASFLAGFQSDFPVFDSNQQPIGLLTSNALVAGLRTGGRVGDVMHGEVAVAETGEPLVEAWQRMQLLQLPLLVVMNEGTPVGIVTSRHVTAVVRVRQALSNQPPSNRPRTTGIEARSPS